jgi:putative membrane protein
MSWRLAELIAVSSPDQAWSGLSMSFALAGAHPLVHLNAALNTLATILLLLALRQVRQRREAAHGRTMIAAVSVSALFLASYLTYHAIAGSVRFTHPGAVRYVYYAVLLSHVLLAFAVPVLAAVALWHGARALGWGWAAATPADLRASARRRHMRVVRWAYPIWLYVSITGVLVYAMLYHLWPSADLHPTLK